jgi:hypothetical protein
MDFQAFVKRQDITFDDYEFAELNYVYKELLHASSVPGPTAKTARAETLFAQVKGNHSAVVGLTAALRAKRTGSDGPQTTFSLHSYMVERGFTPVYTVDPEFSRPCPYSWTSPVEGAKPVTSNLVSGYHLGSEVRAVAGMSQLDIMLANVTAAASAAASRVNEEWKFEEMNKEAALRMCTPVVERVVLETALPLLKQIDVGVMGLSGPQLAGRLYDSISKNDDKKVITGVLGSVVLPPEISQGASDEQKTHLPEELRDTARYMSKTLTGGMQIPVSTNEELLASVQASRNLNAKNWGKMNQGYFDGTFVAPGDHKRNMLGSYFCQIEDDVKVKVVTRRQEDARLIDALCRKKGTQVTFVGISSNSTLKITGEKYLTDSVGCAVFDLGDVVIPTVPSRVKIGTVIDQVTLDFGQKLASYLVQKPDAVFLTGSPFIRVKSDGVKDAVSLDMERVLTPELDRGVVLYCWGNWKQYLRADSVSFDAMCRSINMAAIIRSGWIWRRVSYEKAAARYNAKIGIKYWWVQRLGSVKVASQIEAVRLMNDGVEVDFTIDFESGMASATPEAVVPPTDMVATMEMLDG